MAIGHRKASEDPFFLAQDAFSLGCLLKSTPPKAELLLRYCLHRPSETLVLCTLMVSSNAVFSVELRALVARFPPAQVGLPKEAPGRPRYIPKGWPHSPWMNELGPDQPKSPSTFLLLASGWSR